MHPQLAHPGYSERAETVSWSRLLLSAICERLRWHRCPVNHLLDKGKPWEWTKECELAFSLLKKMLTTSPILAYPDFECEFTINCDASWDGLGAVLSQCIGDAENGISFASRSLKRDVYIALIRICYMD